MAWRGQTAPKDRILSCLPYLLPLIDVYGFGLVFSSLPLLPPILAQLIMWVYIPLYPVMLLYGYIGRFVPFFEFIVFFVLFLLVVRNERLIHFLRFHTMQALMLSIFAYLCAAILQLMGLLQIPSVFSLLTFPVVPAASAPIIVVLLVGVIFLVVVAACIYSIAQALRGMYAEIPVISEAAYAQTR